MKQLHHLAQINIARMKGVSIDDPIMQEFVDNLDRVNTLAESSPGFIWRLKGESNNATNLNPYNDEQIIVNISVWEDVASLENFTYKTFHTDFLKRRKEWFHRFGQAHYAMWWMPTGRFPTVDEAVAKLDTLQKEGPSEVVFDFRNKVASPTLTFTEGQKSDLSAIAQLHATSWQQNYRGILSDHYLDQKVQQERKDVWTERLQSPANNQHIIVAKMGAALIGFTCLYGNKHPQFGSYLDNLHVAKTWKGKGIGRVLMAQAGQWVVEQYPNRGMYLYVLAENTPAIHFYEKIGGKRMLTQAHNLGDGTGQTGDVHLYYWENPQSLAT